MEQKRESEVVDNESKEVELASEVVDEKVNTSEHAKSMRPTPGNKQKAKKMLSKGKRASQRVNNRRYLLRSSQVGTRVLRSRSKEANNSATEPAAPTVNPAPKRKKKRRKGKRVLDDEFSLIRKRLRYLLTRMNYEQSLIEAYSAEGWKGQSLEKIRPEKELERAKSEILRCKLRMRELFKRLDESLSEGRFEENLFDSEGQIDSEDIFCAKCGSKDFSANNDIILCDGNCDRGFHQKCLNPPLLTEEIPPEDEGWLCPACDCKVDCLKLLNESQATHLSIEDTWEKVFPEAAALANGGEQFDDSGHPSDDSEDNDYDPNVPEADTDVHMDGSRSEKSDSVSLSEESVPLNQNVTYDNLGLPSDDSEDDDYDPEGPDHYKATLKESTSDESDFTSDSDEFCDELSKLASNGDAVTSSLSEFHLLDSSVEKRYTMGNTEMNSELQSILKSDPEQENALPLPGKRQRERLDYKKLYDETYSKASSDSNDDEEWSEKAVHKKVKKDDDGQECAVTLEPRAQDITTRKSPRSVQDKLKRDDIVEKSNLEQKQVSQTLIDNMPDNSSRKLAAEHDDVQTPISTGNKATNSAQKHLSREVSQTLQDLFKENQYPSRETKERLSEELGLPFKRICRWFETARHNMRVSAKGAGPGTALEVSVTETNHPGDSTPKMITMMTQTDANISLLYNGVAQGSTGKESSAKISSKRSNSKAGNGHDTMDELESKETLDSKRRKAIERELRKRRNCR